MSQYYLATNEQDPSGQWTIYADDNGTIVGRYDDPDSVRGHLHDIGLDVETDTVMIDGDGNGSIVEVPIDWVGDGGDLIGSWRVIELIGSGVLYRVDGKYASHFHEALALIPEGADVRDYPIESRIDGVWGLIEVTPK